MNERLVLGNLKRLDGRAVDIVLENGRIADVAEAGTARGERILDFSGAYVSSGWIDLHVHAFPEFDPYGDDVDEIGVRRGVTTVADAGSCGADRIADLAAIGARARTRLLAFLNVSRIGLSRIDELSNPEWIDPDAAARAAAEHKNIVVGLKARISRSVVGASGIEPLRRARSLAEKTSLPLMVHIGSGPPDIRDVLALLRRGDIVTHYLNGKANNLFDRVDGEPLPEFREAIRRGVHLDVGHGTASFSFRAAEAAKRHGIAPDTISTDIYRGNRLNGPVYGMPEVLTKFLYLGYPLREVIGMVTSNAARWLGRPELGRIRVGDAGNLTIFTVKNDPVELVDSEGERRTSGVRIQAIGAVAGGEYVACEVRP